MDSSFNHSVMPKLDGFNDSDIFNEVFFVIGSPQDSFTRVCDIHNISDHNISVQNNFCDTIL